MAVFRAAVSVWMDEAARDLRSFAASFYPAGKVGGTGGGVG